GNAIPGPPPDPVTRYATSRNAEHRSAVIRTRFFGGLHGTRTVSASSGGSIRIWNPNEDAMGFEMRQEFMSVRLSVSLLNSNTAELYAELNLGIILNLALNATRENGLERDHDLRLSFARLDEATIARLEVYGIDVATVEDLLRTGLDRSLPTGVPEGQQVQQVRLKKHFDAGRATLGIYVDLALKHVDEDGNITFRRPRGIHGAEQDFRPAEHDIAFATSPQLLAMLGPDAKQRAARPRPDGAIYYPLTEDGLGGTGEIIGKIYDVSVGPRRIAQPNGPAAPAGQLAMHLDILYTKDGVDAGLVAHAYFAPQRTSKKFVEWASELDIDLGVLAKFAVAILGLAFLFIPAGLVGWGLLTFLSVGAFTGITAAAIVEACVAKTLADKVGLEKQAGILDVLPFHIPATDRRNDPFYMMQYQIHAKLDEAVIIDDAGIAFAASDLALKRVPVPQTDVAIRGVEREGGEVTAIHFEVPDFEQLAHRFEQTGPGVDRRSFIRRDVLNAPTIVTLTLAEVLARKAERRVPAPILLEARRIHLAQGRIEHLLCITWRERSVERRRLIREFQQNAREGVIAGELSAIKTAAEAALIARLNRTPSREEREGEIQRRIEGRVAVLQATYEEVSLPGELDAALAPLLRVELAPRELAALQKEGIAVLDGKEIIYRKDANGTPVPYFRDHPDAIKKDNLLALPRYSPPYAPPPA
ncbi:MAG TPA: hypothetical protein VD867_10905, partial [Burkholderiales bacterium]|nr:hypothetical protein [Burkholderiales bacterium]